MAELRQMMEAEVKLMQALLRKLEDNGSNENMDSTLRISVDKGKPRYYIKREDGRYEYIPRKNLQLAKSIAQNQYNQKLHKLLKKRTAQFRRILCDYSETEIDDIYEKEHPERKILVTPLEETKEQTYIKWIREEYEGKAFQEGMPLILTEKGERVRSKSEKILADYFYHKGIEYKYAKSAIKKINSYVRNGIFPGKNLIITYETSTVTLDMECVAAYVREYL